VCFCVCMSVCGVCFCVWFVCLFCIGFLGMFFVGVCGVCVLFVSDVFVCGCV